MIFKNSIIFFLLLYLCAMRKLFIIVAVCFLLFSCSSKQPKKVDSPGNLYVDGVNLLQTKKYSKAIVKFSALRENYPFDPLAIVAAVKLGDVYFADKEYLLAVNVYEDFFKSHPEDENVPYVLSRLGECYEKLSPLVDRDQAYTLKCIERLTYLKNRYAASPYVQTSEPRLKRMTQKLADRELYIGEFYYKTARYNASILRLENLLKKYPDTKGTDKILLYLALSYRELGNQMKSDQYMDRLRTEYPKSLFTRSTIRERKTLQTVKIDVVEGTTALPLYEDKKKRNIDLTPQMVKADQAAVTETEKGKAPGKETQKDKNDVPTKGNEKDKGMSFFDKKKPVDIVSDTMEGFDKEKYVVFKGSVIAKQEDLFIFADTIETYMSEDTNEIEKAIARGNVKIVKQDRTATCREAVFENAKGEITLKDNVIVYQGKDKLTGDVIIYYVNEDRVTIQAEKDKKAHITIQPKEDKK
ncbi:MAG: lipopolysaccharide transport periplasmic protein LptA [Syntrophus sp. (in: bacteria)]|nr:lipopolysaccharide transport periplasmic protein LptA [Syntrophus sp. (in: bacteria)]